MSDYCTNNIPSIFIFVDFLLFPANKSQWKYLKKIIFIFLIPFSKSPREIFLSIKSKQFCSSDEKLTRVIWFCLLTCVYVFKTEGRSDYLILLYHSPKLIHGGGGRKAQ